MLDRDIFAMPIEELLVTRAEMTLVDGALAYDRHGGAS